MAIPLYLALTAAEFRSCREIPKHFAWMACHFSPYGTGLSNLPASMPPDSLLILNDRTPIHGHDPGLIRDTLRQLIEKQQCHGLLLDFQRPDCAETAALAAELIQLPCPVSVSWLYADRLDCPVFLPPVPLRQTVEEFLLPWKGRDIWLDTAMDGEIVTVDPHGSHFSPLPTGDAPECPLYDEDLVCHYRIEIQADLARFTLRRTKEDISQLLKSAEKYGVTHAVGLYQELA